jgi:hypothetical protein
MDINAPKRLHQRSDWFRNMLSKTRINHRGGRRNGARISSARAKSSGATSRSAAAAFSVTCSGRLAPMIAEDTSCLRKTQASANWDKLKPVSLSAISFTCCTAVNTGARSHCFGSIAPMTHDLPLTPPAAVHPACISGQHALGERRPDDLADAELGATRKKLILRKGPKHRILRLTRHETRDAGHLCRRLDLVEGPFAKTNIPRPALTDGRGQSLHRFVERSFLVKAVALIEIDIVGPKPLQRSVELGGDLRAGKRSVRVAHCEKNFGRQHVGCAIDAVQRLAQHALRRAA